jgi:ankyrin repeat protein
VLRDRWSEGLDYNPVTLSEWAQLLFTGEQQAAEGVLDNLSGEQVAQLIERRETQLNVSAVFHVIIGARTGCCKVSDEHGRKVAEDRSGHANILAKLLELGADLEAKDVAGYTPLHHCLTSQANSATLAMAATLLKAGADPNLQNRFGCSPMFECIMVANLAAIKLLLKHGAKTDVTENDGGLTCLDLAKNFPDVIALFSEAGKQVAKRKRQEQKAAGSFDCGGGCGKRGTKRCSGCYLVSHYIKKYLKVHV